LEDLWTGKDPFWKINYQDDSAVEEYEAKHFVPPGFGPNPEEWFGKSSLTIQTPVRPSTGRSHCYQNE
jgi:hypothetical protein